jgi:hypothetical protein
MSMYTELLGAALDNLHPFEVDTPTSDLVAELWRRRRQFGAIDARHRGTGWAPVGVADQLRYDIALIGLARHLGVRCDPGDFDQPEPERFRLERDLIGRGIPLDGSWTESDGAAPGEQ